MDTTRIFWILANEERRWVVKGLLEEDGRLSMDCLAHYIVIRGRDDDGSVTEEELREAKVVLHHQHLPMLADHGVVEYDGERDVATMDDAVALEPYLQAGKPPHF